MGRTLRISAAVATVTVAACAGVSLDSATTPAATSLAAARPAAVCGASFRLLPRHWHQSLSATRAHHRR